MPFQNLHAAEVIVVAGDQSCIFVRHRTQEYVYRYFEQGDAELHVEYTAAHDSQLCPQA